MDGKRHMETTEEYKLLLKFFEQPIEQMEWKYFEEKKFNCLHKDSFLQPCRMVHAPLNGMTHTV